MQPGTQTICVGVYEGVTHVTPSRKLMKFIFHCVRHLGVHGRNCFWLLCIIKSWNWIIPC